MKIFIKKIIVHLFSTPTPFLALCPSLEKFFNLFSFTWWGFWMPHDMRPRDAPKTGRTLPKSIRNQGDNHTKQLHDLLTYCINPIYCEDNSKFKSLTSWTSTYFLGLQSNPYFIVTYHLVQPGRAQKIKKEFGVFYCVFCYLNIHSNLYFYRELKC